MTATAHRNCVPISINIKTLVLFVMMSTLACVANGSGIHQPLGKIPVAHDVRFPGTISLNVDFTNTRDRIERVSETIPVTSGLTELVLFYPEFVFGGHGRVGPIANIAGIVTTVDGERVQWIRDAVDVYAFHIPLHPGAKSVSLYFDYLSPITPGQGPVELTETWGDLEWNRVLMYPAGYYVRDIPVQASIEFQKSWRFATALATNLVQPGSLSFEPTDLEALVDSPVYAGTHYMQYDLSPTSGIPIHLNLFADNQADLVVAPGEIAALSRIPREAFALFGVRHFAHYDFLVVLHGSSEGGGLEHSQSSEDTLPANFFDGRHDTGPDGSLLTHEFVHSWNGKFRRPVDLWTPNYNSPMRNYLLWVYEGLTQYYGDVLSARVGLRTAEQARAILTSVAAEAVSSTGRGWRPLADTTDQTHFTGARQQIWPDFQRGQDFYYEGELLWREIDTKIRQLTHDRRSLDDFCRLFFGVKDGRTRVLTYTLGEVIKVLNRVAPSDWQDLLHKRVDEVQPQTPTIGLAQAGWQLNFADETDDPLAALNVEGDPDSFRYSLGLRLGDASVPDTGLVEEVLLDGPAYRSGIVPGMELVSVEDASYTPQRLTAAILAAEKQHRPISLQFRQGAHTLNLHLAYFGGLRLPRLRPIVGSPDKLQDILKPAADVR